MSYERVPTVPLVVPPLDYPLRPEISRFPYPPNDLIAAPNIFGRPTEFDYPAVVQPTGRLLALGELPDTSQFSQSDWAAWRTYYAGRRFLHPDHLEYLADADTRYPRADSFSFGPDLSRKFAMMGAIIAGRWEDYDANRGVDEQSFITTREAFEQAYGDPHRTGAGIFGREIGLPIIAAHRQFTHGPGVLTLPHTQGFDWGPQSVSNLPAWNEVWSNGEDIRGYIHVHPGKYTRETDLHTNHYASYEGVSVEEYSRKDPLRQRILEAIAGTVVAGAHKITKGVEAKMAPMVNRLMSLRELAKENPSAGDLQSLACIDNPLSVIVVPPQPFVSMQNTWEIGSKGMVFALTKRADVDYEAFPDFETDKAAEEKIVRENVRARKAVESSLSRFLMRHPVGTRMSDEDILGIILRPLADMYRKYGFDMQVGLYPQGRVPDEGIQMITVRSNAKIMSRLARGASYYEEQYSA